MPAAYHQVFPDALGRLASNIVQLEFAIRVALHLQEPAAAQMPYDALRNLRPGDVVPQNYLTNWDTLGKLIAEYNRRESERGGKVIDKAIVDLRDALAHGRLSASTMASEHRLIRFARPDPVTKMVAVESVETVTLDWLDQQIRWTAQAMQVVFARILELKPDARLK